MAEGKEDKTNKLKLEQNQGHKGPKIEQASHVNPDQDLLIPPNTTITKIMKMNLMIIMMMSLQNSLRNKIIKTIKNKMRMEMKEKMNFKERYQL